MSFTGITLDTNVLLTTQWYTTQPSLTYLYTLSEFNDARVFLKLDYSMFTDTLVLLVGADSQFSDGYTIGYNTGVTDGYEVGKSDGYDEGHRLGKIEGRDEGYTEGYNDGVDTDGTAAAIYAGIIATGMIPIQFFLSIFNFEIFGINLTGLVTSLMSICIVLIVIKRTFAIHEDS